MHTKVYRHTCTHIHTYRHKYMRTCVHEYIQTHICVRSKLSKRRPARPERATPLLGGSWLVISRVISRITTVITHITGLISFMLIWCFFIGVLLQCPLQPRSRFRKIPQNPWNDAECFGMSQVWFAQLLQSSTPEPRP